MLKLSGVGRSIGRATLLSGISLELPDSSRLAIVGPSGSGKTSLLRLIAGLDVPDEGEMQWRGESFSLRGRVVVAPEKRNFAMVFQDTALFPHLNVEENVAYGAGAKEKVELLLGAFALTNFRRRSVQTLSGGEKQRVAMARSLATDPSLLLLDEPFSNIDRLARHQLIEYLKKTLEGRKVALVVVTHDARDALDLDCDKILVLKDGRQVRFGNFSDVITRPEDAWTENFLKLCFGTGALR